MKTSELADVLTQGPAYCGRSSKAGCCIWNSERVGDLPPVRQRVASVRVNSVRLHPAGEPIRVALAFTERRAGSDTGVLQPGLSGGVGWPKTGLSRASAASSGPSGSVSPSLGTSRLSVSALTAALGPPEPTTAAGVLFLRHGGDSVTVGTR